jgi:HD-GYP domain-containing protein (c-di-GMP phosphodiesterase class II)
MVNAIDQKDQYTCGHSERVGFLSMVTGKAMGLKISQLQELEWGGLLHDVGKIGIPEKVLNKPARLTDEEFAIIKHHPARGYAVLKPIGTLKDVLDIVLHHHEVPDGTGYPKGLKGDAIPLLARIVHVVDAFDALTSDRPYRRPYSPEKAISILRQDAGTKFDSIIVEFFIEVWQHLSVEYPREHQKWFASLQGLQ